MLSTKAQNRILHCSDQCKEHLSNARVWAMTNGCIQKLEEALDYLRTYSAGPEEEWKTELRLDRPFNKNRFDFIATIYRRNLSVLTPFMTIGMIWDERNKEWSMHS